MPKIHDGLKIYNANALRSGLVVFLTKDFTWSEKFTDALIIDHDETLIKKCEAIGERDVINNQIVEPYWILTKDGTYEGMHMREKMRVLGPTVGTDYEGG